MSLPAPLVDDDVGMDGNDWFPLYYDRLLGSRFWRGASDLARARSVMLWAHAYKETPPASLPNDDVDLADMAGFGTGSDAVAAFLKHKAEILTPWILCSDGRLYHPTLAEVVAESWAKMNKQRQAAATRKRRSRANLRAKVTGDGGFGAAKSEPVTRDTPPMSRVTPPPVTSDEQTQTDRHSSDPSDRAPSAPSDPNKEAWDRAVRLFVTRGAGMPETKARGVFGRLLKGGLAAPQLLPEIIRAELNGTEDPVAYLTKAAQAIRHRAGIPDEAAQPAPLDPTMWGDSDWAMAVAVFHEDHMWDACLGPEPGKPGCRVPAHLLLREAKVG